MASMDEMPALPPPPGEKSNFVDPVYDGNRFVVVNVVFLFISFMSVVIRLWTRTFIARGYRWDDCKSFTCCGSAILTAAVLMITSFVCFSHWV